MIDFDILVRYRVQQQAHFCRKRARKYGVEGPDFTAIQFLLLKQFAGNRCLRCRRTESRLPKIFKTHIYSYRSKPALTPDHIVPLHMGGDNSILNIQPLCFSCNCAKTRVIVDFRSQAIHAFAEAISDAPPHREAA